MPRTQAPFVRETHGIHAGTMTGPVKHGIDDLEEAVARAIELGHPSISFVIHTPRLTTYRYAAERELGLKFIRGDGAFAGYVAAMDSLRARYAGRIDIRFGIELEWQGLGLGLTWSRAKIEQARGVDFVIGSIHFSGERIPYDGTPAEAARLLALRGSPEAYWALYLDEMADMIEAWGDLIHVVGHLDLPKLHVPPPPEVLDPLPGASRLARKVRTILWKLADRGIALDVNLSGEAKGCGPYPAPGILAMARELGVPISLGTDSHALGDIGALHGAALDYVGGLGFERYVSFRRGRPQLRLLCEEGAGGREDFERLLNAGLSLVGQLDGAGRSKLGCQAVALGLGDGFSAFRRAAGALVPAGRGRSVLLRREGRSLLVALEQPEAPEFFSGIYFVHRDRPGVLALLASVLASEGINLDEAYLFNPGAGTGRAFISTSGSDQAGVENACDFALGTNSEHFIELIPDYAGALPAPRPAPFYIRAIDDVELEMAAAPQMVHSVHEDRPGALLILLAALAARGVNVLDLRLTHRHGLGHALLAVQGDPLRVDLALESVRPEFRRLSYLALGEDELAP